MATPTLVTTTDFTTSRYSQVADNTEGNLSDILARAEASVQSWLGRKLALGNYLYRGRPSSQRIITREYPLQSVVSARRRLTPLSGWQYLNLVNLLVYEQGYIESYEPITGYEVEITYVAGYASIPEDIKEAILLQAVLFSTQDLEVYGSGDSRAPGYVQPFTEQIKSLLMPHKSTGNIG